MTIIIHFKLRFKIFDFRDIFEGLIHKKKRYKIVPIYAYERIYRELHYSPTHS